MKTNFKIRRQWPWIYLRFSVSKNLYFAKFSSNVWPVHSWKREDVENRGKMLRRVEAKSIGYPNDWSAEGKVQTSDNSHWLKWNPFPSLAFICTTFPIFFRLNVDQLEKKCNNKNVPFFQPGKPAHCRQYT